MVDYPAQASKQDIYCFQIIISPIALIVLFYFACQTCVSPSAVALFHSALSALASKQR